MADWTIGTAALLLCDVLPDIVELANFYATSHEQEALLARQTTNARNPRRPFHVFLYQYLVQLQAALLRMPTWMGKSDDRGILYALLGVLDAFEHHVVLAHSGSHFAAVDVSTQSFRLMQSFKQVLWPTWSNEPRIYRRVRNWIADGRCRRDDKLLWLRQSTCLETPQDHVTAELLRVLKHCFRTVEDQLPMDVPCIEQDEKISYSARQQIVWQNVQDLCNGMENVHQQLANTWSCKCSHAHNDIHFAIDPRGPLDNGFVASSLLYNSDGWKQSSVRMRYTQALNEAVSYRELCEDLVAASGDRAWYTIHKCSDCAHPMTFDEVWRGTNSPPLFRQRLCLVVILSHLYLHLSGGAWWPYSRTDSTIHFQRADRKSFLPLSPPIFAFDTAHSAKPDFRAECINPCMPNLVEFGKLILEIVTWEPLSWEGNETEQRLKSLPNTDLPNADRVISAVIACMGFKGEDRLKAKVEEQTIRNSERMRMEFVQVVIQNLESVLFEAYGVDTETIFSPTKLTTAPSRTRTHLQKTSDNAHIELASRTDTRGQDNNTSAERHGFPDVRITSDSLPLLNDDTGNQEPVERHDIGGADKWLAQLLPLKNLSPEDSDPATQTKIGVLDTGLHFDLDIADVYPNRYEAYCFLDDNDEPIRLEVDEDGHGTHVASIILELSSNCKVFSGRICRSRKEVRGKESSKEVAARIARAIEHAVDVWKVDIISMSFGFGVKSTKIENAIKHACNQRVLMVAAAGNNGSLEQVRYPARDSRVLCCHAATGHGGMYRNPTKKKNNINLAFLGVAVEGCQPGRSAMVRRSGTSQATAVAAGLAGLIIQLMKDCREQAMQFTFPYAYDNAMGQLKQLDGMRRLFEEMSNRRGDYDIVEPWTILDKVMATKWDMVAGLLCHKIANLMDTQYEDD